MHAQCIQLFKIRPTGTNNLEHFAFHWFGSGPKGILSSPTHTHYSVLRNRPCVIRFQFSWGQSYASWYCEMHLDCSVLFCNYFSRYSFDLSLCGLEGQGRTLVSWCISSCCFVISVKIQVLDVSGPTKISVKKIQHAQILHALVGRRVMLPTGTILPWSSASTVSSQ